MSNQKIVTEAALSALASDIKTVLSEKANSNDVYNALELKADKSELYNILPTEQESGAIAHFTDGADNIPVKSLVSQIVAVQDLHGYDKPWVGGAGKNKLEFPYTDSSKTVSGITYTVKGNGDIAISGTATAASYFTFNHARQLVGNGQYIFSKGTTDTVILGADRCRISNNAFINRYADNTSSPTTPEITINIEDADNNYARFWICVKNGETVNTIIHPMVRLASEPDATFEPYSNICPITGFDSGVVTRCSKNLLPPYNLTGSGTLTINSNNGVYSISGTTSSYRNDVASDSFFLKAGTYTFKNIDNRSNYINAQLRSVNGQTIYASSSTASSTFTLTETTEVKFRFTFQANNTYNETCKPELEIGNEANSFNQYNGNTYTFAFGQTVYGGKLNVTTGELKINKAYLGVDDFTFSTGVSAGGLHWADYSDPNIDINGVSYCSLYPKAISGNAGWVSRTPVYSVSTSKIIRVYTDKTTVEDFKATTNLQVVYSIVEPITVQLTPTEVKTLLGENNIYSNCGDVEVDYHADIGLYIDKKISSLAQG